MTIYKDLKIGSSVNGTSQRYTYNVTSSVSSLSGADANGNTLAYDSGFADVYLNGVRLSGADITITSGNAVSFASNLSNGDVVDIVAYGAFAVASINADNISSGTVPDARITGTYTGLTGLDLTDNSKIRLGTGNDLEIYHDGSHSFIADEGTGNLTIKSNGAGIELQKGNSEYLARFKTDNAVELYYDNAKKFETTSTGATVTGVASASGAFLSTVNNSLLTFGGGNAGNVGSNLTMYGGANGSAGDFRFRNATTINAFITGGGQIQGIGGAVSAPTFSFTNDSNTGMSRPTTDAINFVTAGAERLRITSAGEVGIATSSVINGEKLKVQGKVYINAPESNTAFTVGACLIFPETYNNIRQSTDHALNFDTYNGGSVLTPLTIKQDGKIGIGTTSPSEKLEVRDGKLLVKTTSGAATIEIVSPGGTSDSVLNFGDSADNNVGAIAYEHDNNAFRFLANVSERMRINSDGRLLVGKTDTARTTAGAEIRGDGFIRGTKSGGHSFDAVRTSDQGDVIRIYSENNLVGVLGTEKWGIGTSAPSTTLDVVGNATITTADNSNTLSLVSTDADANAGPILSMRRESATPADNDLIGQVDFMGKDSGGVNTQYASIKAIIKDATNNTEDGALEFVNYKSGFLNNALTLGNTETVFNDASLGIDFRVESNGNANMLLVDGSADRVGIGTANPQNKLDIVATTWNEGLTIKTTGNTNVGIITDSNRTTAGGGLFNLQARWNGTEVAGILFEAGSDTTNKDDGELVFRTASAGTPSERMRIDSSGRLLVGATSAPGNEQNGFVSSDPILGLYRTSSSTSGAIVRMYSDVGGTKTVTVQIENDGDINNTNNSYGALSDRNLKENEVDASSQWNDIKSIQVKNYNLKSLPDKTHLGVIAQDLEASGMNGLVKTDEDGTKSVKYSILYMKSVKALQEAMERIETLEARTTTLENN